MCPRHHDVNFTLILSAISLTSAAHTLEIMFVGPGCGSSLLCSHAKLWHILSSLASSTVPGVQILDKKLMLRCVADYHKSCQIQLHPRHKQRSASGTAAFVHHLQAVSSKAVITTSNQHWHTESLHASIDFQCTNLHPHWRGYL